MYEFLRRSSPMADLVLLFHGQFCEGAVITVRLEDGVVAESVGSMPFRQDCTGDNPLEEVFLSVEDERDHRPEPGAAVLFPFEFRQQFVYVRLGVFLRSCVPC